MKPTFTRRYFTRMTAAAAVAAGLTPPRHSVALLAQNSPLGVEEPGAVAHGRAGCACHQRSRIQRAW